MPMFWSSMGVEGWLFMAGWVVVLAVLVWALVREPRHVSGDGAMEILRARFARGEINGDEFARATDLLKSQPMNRETPR